jgi:diguanylate cyclase (GGDEF)-like protein/PAS domain S-box-containing protein
MDAKPGRRPAFVRARRGLAAAARRRLWLWYLLAAVPGIAAFALVASPRFQASIYGTYGLAAAAATVTGARAHRPSRRLPWLLIAGGLCVWWEGDVVWGIQSAWLGSSGSTPWSDGLWLAGYPLLVGGLLLLSTWWLGSRREAASRLLDSLQLAIIGSLAAWILLAEPASHRAAAALGEKVISGAYPTLDLVLLALALRLLRAGRLRPASARLLAGAFAAQLCSDIVWRDLKGAGGYDVGALVNTGHLVGYALLGAAALHPGMAELCRLEPPHQPALPRSRVALLAASALAVPLLIVARQTGLDRGLDLDLVALAAGATGILTLGRLVSLVRAVERQSAFAEHAERRTKAVLEASPVPITLIGPDGNVELWNHAAERVSGVGAAEAKGKPAPITPAGDPAAATDLRRRARAGEAVSGLELTVVRRGGEQADIVVSTAPVGEGGSEGIVASWLDVTEHNRQAEQIRYLASHDAVTGLPNRWAFDAYLLQTAGRASPGRPALLLMVDVDNFKRVNDTAGHDQGDRLLALIAERFEQALRPGDFLARAGGDEFAAIVHDVGAAQGRLIAERVLNEIGALRFSGGGHLFDVAVSIGACTIPPGARARSLYAQADAALRVAKERGKNRISFADDASVGDLQPAADNRIAIEISDAIAEERLLVYLQPVVSLVCGRRVHSEALVRMRRRNGETALPGAFLPAAERLGLMPRIDRFVLETVIPELRDDPGLRVFVNLSPSSFEDDALLDWVAAELRLGGFAPAQLGFEITETTAIRDLERTGARMGELAAIGCPLALDDFGVGFSSFLELKTLPVGFVKIGGAFVADLLADESSRAIVGSIVQVSRALGKQVIAEEVEDAAVVNALRKLGVEYGQGFHWSRPHAYAFGHRRDRRREAGVAGS